MANQPIPLKPSTNESDELTFKACATEVFRWIRSGIDVLEETPAMVAGLASDIEQAWRDSAKR